MHTIHPSPEALRLAMTRIESVLAVCGGDREVPWTGGSFSATAAAPSPAMAAGTRSAA